MATFSQQFGQLGQQANPAISDATQNKNPGGFPNAKPAQIGGMQRMANPVGNPILTGGGGRPQGMTLPTPNYGQPRGPFTGFNFGPRQPMNGNRPGVGGVGGVQPGAFGRIEKGAWNDPNMRRGMGSPFGVQLPNNLPGFANQFGGGQIDPRMMMALPANDQAAQEMLQRRAIQQGPSSPGTAANNWASSRDMVPYGTPRNNPDYPFPGRPARPGGVAGAPQAAPPVTDGGITANGPGNAGAAK